MKKYLSISLIVILVALTANAQFPTYSSYDNEYSAVYEVEDMDSYEIKDYNSWAKEGSPHESSMMFINSYRAQINLINAPATIIDFHLYNGEDNPGALMLIIELINSTPKTIKEISLEFEFKNDGTPVYDIKSGDRYLVLKFANLKGRTKSEMYDDVAENIFNSYHMLKSEDAINKKLFYNKKANTARLHSAKIKYTDGSTSSNIAIFYNGYSGKETLLNDGPLSPIVKYLNHIKKDEAQDSPKKTKQDEIKDETEVFHSAAHMPSYPGGDAALMKYLNDHMIYPEQAKNDGIQGRVIVQFVVRKDGTIGDTKVSRGVDKYLNQEAIRLVKSLPKFSPGRNAIGDTVDVWYTLPITFKVPGLN